MARPVQSFPIKYSGYSKLFFQMSGGWILQQRRTDEEIITPEGPIHLGNKQDKSSPGLDYAEKICWQYNLLTLFDG